MNLFFVFLVGMAVGYAIGVKRGYAVGYRYRGHLEQFVTDAVRELRGPLRGQAVEDRDDAGSII